MIGSPPPTRGTPKGYNDSLIYDGITPAYAGNTFTGCQQICERWDHPRLRGEHVLIPYRRHIPPGSPPPTRGTPTQPPQCQRYFRITPAYAGNTAYRGILTRAIRDHPRLRGEHPYSLAQKYADMGSPPPTRGTHMCYYELASGYGITPAYAGNTKYYDINFIKYEDHPRLRGEHIT